MNIILVIVFYSIILFRPTKSLFQPVWHNTIVNKAQKTV